MNPSKRPTLAVALIVKNEGHNLKACLDSVAGWVDEIVILDSGSTDDTETIARGYTEHFYRHTDWQGFGKQRQVAQTHVTAEYVLWLDADERVSSELKSSILAALDEAQPNTLFQVNRLSYVFGRFIRHCGWYPDRVTRLYRTKMTTYDAAGVHEKVVIPENATVDTLDGDLYHYTYRDLEHYLVKSAGYAKAWADDRHQRGKTSGIGQATLHALTCFIKMYLIKAGFLDGRQGLILSLLSAHSTFVKYIDLWSRSQDLVPKE